jgi:histone-lysine N-methyltransferase SETMAR
MAILVEFLPQGSTINAGVYCDTLKKQCGMLSRGVVMLHDNACPHTATFGWEQFDHPPYSLDLAPSDFHVFLHLKTYVGGRQFHDDKVQEAVNIRFASQVAPLYAVEVQKLVPHYKCLNNGETVSKSSVRYVH